MRTVSAPPTWGPDPPCPGGRRSGLIGVWGGPDVDILFVSQYFVPEMGAPAVRTYDTCRRWVADGHRVQVVTGVPNHPTGKLHPGYRNRLWQHEDVDGVDVIRMWTFLTANRGRVRRSIQYVLFMLFAVVGGLIARRPAVVIGTSPQILVALAAWAVSFLRRIPFVMEVRDLWPDSVVAVGGLKNPLLIGMLRAIERFLYHRAAHIVVVTESFRTRLGELGVPDGKISVVTNACDIETFCPRLGSEGLRREHGLEGKFVVSYIGTHGMSHGLDTVLDTAHELRHHERFHFVFVGEGAEKARLKQRCRQLSLSNVTFVDGQPRQMMPDWIAAADLHLVHLKPEPLFKTVIPSKIFEIMAMGKPMICAVDGEARSIVEKVGAGVFSPPGNHEALADLIADLADDPAALDEMGLCGREAALTIYNRDILARRYLGRITGLPKAREELWQRRHAAVRAALTRLVPVGPNGRRAG